jgi:hypothetical protein
MSVIDNLTDSDVERVRDILKNVIDRLVALHGQAEGDAVLRRVIKALIAQLVTAQRYLAD